MSPRRALVVGLVLLAALVVGAGVAVFERHRRPIRSHELVARAEGFAESEALNGWAAVVAFEGDSDDVARAHIERARLLYRKRAFADTLLEAQAAIDAAPANSRGYFWRGLVRAEFRQRDAGKADFERALALDPRFAAAWCVHANILRAEGDRDGARHDYDRALECDPSDAITLANRGILDLDEEKDALACRDLAKSVELDDSDANAHGLLACALIRTGDYTGALAAAERAIARDQRCAIGWSNAAAAHVRLEQHELAVRCATRAIELDGSRPWAWFNRGLARLALLDAGGEEDVKHGFELGVTRSPDVVARLDAVRARLAATK